MVEKERCIVPFVINAERNAKFLLNPQAENLFIVVNVLKDQRADLQIKDQAIKEVVLQDQIIVNSLMK